VRADEQNFMAKLLLNGAGGQAQELGLPITNDQPGVAVRIERLGIGERVMRKRISQR